jgi:hypothetical protein
MATSLLFNGMSFNIQSSIVIVIYIFVPRNAWIFWLLSGTESLKRSKKRSLLNFISRSLTWDTFYSFTPQPSYKRKNLYISRREEMFGVIAFFFFLPRTHSMVGTEFIHFQGEGIKATQSEWNESSRGYLLFNEFHFLRTKIVKLFCFNAFVCENISFNLSQSVSEVHSTVNLETSSVQIWSKSINVQN